MTTSVREVLATCLGRTGPLSLKKDLFGIHVTFAPGRTRSARAQLTLIRTKQFVRVTFVTVAPSPVEPTSLIGLDLDTVNDLFQVHCDAWVYGAASIVAVTDLLGSNGRLDQYDCNHPGPFAFLGVHDHDVSDEEDALFDLGRGLGADIVCYLIPGVPDVAIHGCAAHPDGRPGLWISTFPDHNKFVLAHELAHLLGLGHTDDPDNLMHDGRPGTEITAPQCWRMFGDGVYDRPFVERCGS